MRKTGILILNILMWLPISLGAQHTLSDIRLTRLFEKDGIRLYDSTYLLNPHQSEFDTVHISFLLTNDLEKDTVVYIYESRSEHFLVRFTDVNDPSVVYNSLSGREHYQDAPYEYVYCPALPVRVDSGRTYHVEISYAGAAYAKVAKSVYLLSPLGFQKSMADVRLFEETNNIVTYFYIGSLTFGFGFFLFLFIKSRYFLFGLYALFLFIHVLYGMTQIDAYTLIGRFMMSRPHWDDYVNEILVFVGQAVYVHFMARWLGVRNTNRKVYIFLNSISLFFLTYAFSVWLLYTLDRNAHEIDIMMKWIRLLSVGIQASVFFVLLFKVKSPVKGYVLAGTCFVILFGVGFVSLNLAGKFDHTIVKNFDNGSWYMIGILCETMCFASGMGLRYFLIDQSNTQLQAENIKVLEDKLTVEQEARENERKLAELNQELTNQQLTALRAQMNPHFIFNALNSIQKYVVTGSVDEANSYLSKFSRLQRMILSYSDENFISLDKELDILKLYLELEQLRLTNEFHFDIILDEDIEPEEIKIPPMMLQPFAENAIWHGLIPKPGEKRLKIEFQFKDDNTLICSVEDNGIGRPAAQKLKEEKRANSAENKSRGMSLVYNRLAILERKYGTGFSVRIVDKVNEQGESLGTLVELTIPITG